MMAQPDRFQPRIDENPNARRQHRGGEAKLIGGAHAIDDGTDDRAVVGHDPTSGRYVGFRAQQLGACQIFWFDLNPFSMPARMRC